MPRILLFLSFFLLPFLLNAQRQFPPDIPELIDKTLAKAYDQEKKKNNPGIEAAVKEIDGLIKPLKQDYPLFTAVVGLYQSFYAVKRNDQLNYLSESVQLLKGSKNVLADSFPNQFKQLLGYFEEKKRMNDWKSIDSILRESVAVSKSKTGYDYSLMNYAFKKLNEKEYFISKNIAEYDYKFMNIQGSTTVQDKLRTVYNEWLALKGDLDQWIEMPYHKRLINDYEQYGVQQPDWVDNRASYTYLREKDFKKAFTKVIKDLREIRNDVITKNLYDSKSFNKDNRLGYYNIYIAILKGLYEWASRDHRHATAILPYKRFLIQELLPEEMDIVADKGLSSLISAGDLQTLFINLSDLYYSVGNGSEAIEVATIGQGTIGKFRGFSTDEKVAALIFLYQSLAKANRLEGNFQRAHQLIAVLKKYTARPDTLRENTRALFENYSMPKLETIYTLIAEKKDDQATDSLQEFIEDLNRFTIVPEELIYKTTTWTHIQFLVATQSAKRGKWDVSLINEGLDDLEGGRTQLEIFYPTQLLLLKGLWQTEKKFYEGTLNNLLFYTGRQLQQNFILLTPEERMRLYEQRLNPYFDVYHELLFSGKLDSFPALKEKVIAQSLHLKNALIDGNILPNDLLVKKGDTGMTKLVEKIRSLRQEVNLNLSRSKISNRGLKSNKEMKDQMQAMWLEVIEGQGMDSLIRFPDWKSIASKLKTEQAYIETVRYNSWLSDSSARYGAYIISPNKKIKPITICKEDSLVALLNDPSASPQTASLSMEGNRGAKIGKTNNTGKSYQKGSPDKLAQLIIPTIQKNVIGKKEWIMVHDGLLNRISFCALLWQNKFLHEWVSIRQLSANYSLSQQNMNPPVKSKVLLAGGLTYEDNPTTYNKNRLFNSQINWPYLPGTKQEVQQLVPLFKAAGVTTQTVSENAFPDSLRKMLEQYQFIHLSTHGFYFDSTLAKNYYATQWDKDAVKSEPLFRCGIAVSNVNNPDSAEKTETDGYLLGYELANTDLRNCYLITLSACETGLGDLRNNMGVDGLPRALKIGGAKNLLISLWKVPDQPTAKFMELFYKHLFSGKSPAASLQATQLQMSKMYEAKDWAAFILIE